MRPSASGSLLLRVAVALAATLTVAGASLLVPTHPLVVRRVADDPQLESRTRLPREEALSLAESTRRYVLGAAPALDPRFGAQEADHLRDVRSVLALRWLALPSALALAALMVLGRRWRREVGATLAWTGAGLIIGLAACFVAGLMDFDALFTVFHGLFFAPGTWMFAAEDLVTRVFPYPFWVTDGAVWGASALLGAAILALGGLVFRADRSSERG